MYTYKDIFKDKGTILFVVAHPDDLEAYFGGLAARLILDEKQVFVVLCSDGDNGERVTLAKHRIAEEMQSFSVLGIGEDRLRRLQLEDGKLSQCTENMLEVITGLIRKIKPDIICTHDPNSIYSYSPKLKGFFINHRDHRAVGESVIDAVYPFARSTSFFHNQLQGNVTPHVVSNLFLSSDQYPDPNAKIEITKVVEKKRKAMLAHKSQFSKKLVDQIITEDNKTGKKYFEYGRFVNLLF